MKKIILIFLCAFALNVLWENVHSVLYANYMGGEITQFILIRASLFDAFVITLFVLPFIFCYALQKRTWLIVVLGVVIGVCNEWYGLSTHRWMYNSFMPILPIIKVGLTPAVQLGILGYLSYKLGEYFSTQKNP